MDAQAGSYQAIQQPFIPPKVEATTGSTPEHRDVVWAVLFMLQFLGMCGLGGYSYYDLTRAVEWRAFSLPAGFWMYTSLFIVLSVIVSVAFLWFMQRAAHCLVWFTVVLSAALFGVLGFFALLWGQVVAAVMCWIAAGINLLWVYCVRDRIAFTAVTLQLVSAVIQAYPSTILVAVLGSIAQSIWSVLWAGAFFYVYNALNDRYSTSNNQYLEYILLVSLYWGCQVLKNIVHVTVAGTLASWYFFFPTEQVQDPTMKSFKRATTYSFGSICLGSLLIALVQAARQMLNSQRNSGNIAAKIIASCLLACLDSLIHYFNVYAFTFVAIYGHSYCQAAKDTWQLLSSKGVDAVINDNLADGVLTIGCFIIALVVALAGYFIMLILPSTTSVDTFIWVGVGVVFGFIIGICCMEVVGSGVVALFVCFATDPARLHDTKPDVYNTLTTAWNQRYPTCNFYLVQGVVVATMS